VAYITKELLEEFTGKFPEAETELPAVYAGAAADAVARYLHYDPELKEYAVELWGDGTDSIVLPAPVSSVLSVSVNGCAQEPGGWEWKKNYLSHRLANGQLEIFPSDVRLKVSFMGGFDPVPGKIVTTALQLAALYWESAGGNIAVASTSFADTGTRVFNNFREDRFLEQINEWRIYHV
jgi:hypothetical protein